MRKLEAAWSPDAGADIIQAIEDGIIYSRHFDSEFNRREPGWKPLTPKWESYKRAHNFDSRKWIMTGATYNSLTTRAKISPGGGEAVYRVVRFIENNSKRVRAEWKFLKGAAGIGERAVWKNNAIRQWISQILPGSAAYQSAVRRARIVIRKLTGLEK